MHQICDGYNPRVLMGNWYEQSFSVSQPARDNPKSIARKPQIDISFKDRKGNIKPLNRISRLQPWNTSCLVQMGNTKNQLMSKNRTMNQKTYDYTTISNYHNNSINPNTIKQNIEPFTNKDRNYAMLLNVTGDHKMFNSKNVSQLNNNRMSDQSSFRSQLRQNKHIDPKTVLQTIYQQGFLSNVTFDNRKLRNPFIPQTTSFKQQRHYHQQPNYWKSLMNSSNQSNPNNAWKNSQNYENKFSPKFKEANNTLNKNWMQSGHNDKDTNFRRIRSEITFKSVPFHTNK